jgi:hypothetical protein
MPHQEHPQDRTGQGEFIDDKARVLSESVAGWKDIKEGNG